MTRLTVTALFYLLLAIFGPHSALAAASKHGHSHGHAHAHAEAEAHGHADEPHEHEHEDESEHGDEHEDNHDHEHGDKHGHRRGHDHGSEDHAGHEHVAPHGGTLVLLGSHGTGAHLELVLTPENGEVRGYLLDGEAEDPVRARQEQIEIEVDLGNGKVFDLALKAQGNPLSGETVGDTSEFAGKDSLLVGAGRFKAVIRSIDVRGSEHRAVAFDFPEGNE